MAGASPGVAVALIDSPPFDSGAFGFEVDEQDLAFLADGVCVDLAANGTDVRMWRYDDESHVGTVATSADDRMQWIDDRLAGRVLTDGVAFAGEWPIVADRCPGEPEPTDDLPASSAPTVVPVADTPAVSPSFAG